MDRFYAIGIRPIADAVQLDLVGHHGAFFQRSHFVALASFPNDCSVESAVHAFLFAGQSSDLDVDGGIEFWDFDTSAHG